MRMKHLIAAALTALTLSGCSLVYRIDIPQGNYVEQKQVDKLRQGMTREQVEFVLGSPMLRDSFDPNTWYYLYEFQPGRGDKERKELTLNGCWGYNLAGEESVMQDGLAHFNPDWMVSHICKPEAIESQLWAMHNRQCDYCKVLMSFMEE